MLSHFACHRKSSITGILLGLTCLGIAGCHDGPMYQLKHVNPYFTMNEWSKDRELGVTDYERRTELESLASTIGSKTPERQLFWSDHLQKVLDNDENIEMRRLAVLAASNLTDVDSTEILEKGLDDDVAKVRMEACRALGKRADQDAARLLVATIGTESNVDVKHAALQALGNHKSPTAVDSLRVALSDQNPATRKLAISSLKNSTGKDYGDKPDVWIAALDGSPVPEQPTRFAEKLRSIF